jgi:hypothetical protein
MASFKEMENEFSRDRASQYIVNIPIQQIFQIYFYINRIAKLILVYYIII